MKQLPILFSTPMVQAIQANRKTQTRRLKGLEYLQDKPRSMYFGNSHERDDVPRPAIKYDNGIWYWFSNDGYSGRGDFVTKAPYEPGDLLWVRETWSKIHYECVDTNPTYIYKADMADVNRIWKPSIHMPKAAARYWLKVKSVRPERIQDITEEDAKNEGAHMCHFENDSIYSLKEYTYNDRLLFHPTYKTGFKLLWASINGEESWKRNDWVWRVEFERTEKP